MKTIQTLRDEVRARIGNEYRFAHILGVETECAALASFFELDAAETRSLRIAGLLHDLTKQQKTDEQKTLYERFSLPFGEVEEHSPRTLHAVTGAYLARALYPEFVTDEIFDAIRTHTTGERGMSLMQKLVYLADYIEPGRTFEDCVRVRTYFYQNPEGEDRETLLNRALLLSFDLTLDELIREGSYIHPLTVAARNGILMELNGGTKTGRNHHG